MRSRSRSTYDHCDGGAGRAAPRDEVRRLQLVGRAHRSSRARPGRRRVGGRRAHRLGRSAAGAARLSRQVLGECRHRDRRRRRASTGGALRPVSYAPGGSTWRAAADSGQGTNRSRLRRSHVLGHRGVRAAAAHLPPATRRLGRVALAPSDAGPGPRSRTVARAARRGVSMANDRRRGMLGLLAGGHGGVPHQRGDRERRRALPADHPGRDVRARGGGRAARRDCPVVALARPP